MSVSEAEGDTPRFFFGCEDGEGDELLDQGKVYDCLYEHVEEDDDDDDEEYESVCSWCG